MNPITEARGWLELGSPLKAWEMLEDLPPERRTHPDVLSLRLAICAALMKWELGLELLRALEGSHDDQHRQDCAAFCHAYARELCYKGEGENAKACVRLASKWWPDIRLAMVDDPALKGVWQFAD